MSLSESQTIDPNLNNQNPGRIAIIGARGYPSFYGGFETLLRHLVPYLSNRGWEVDVYCRPDTTNDRSEDDTNVTQIFTRGIETKSLSTLSYGLTSTAHAAGAKPDVALVLNVANGFWLPLLKARGVRTAVNVDGIEWERQKWGAAAKRIFLAGASLTAKFADELIFDSTNIGDRWRADFNRSGTFVPYGGIDDSGLPPLPEFPPGSYALYVARFVPENSVIEFLEAAKEVSKYYPVVIVGSSGYDGPLDRQVKRLNDECENVTWLGHVKDDQVLHALWANAGVYYHGHSVGGTNPALVQAMACGAPIVARDTPYNREVLSDLAHFSDSSPGSIAHAMLRLLRDSSLRNEAAEVNRARQLESYTWSLVCERYNTVFTSLRELQRSQR